MNDATNTAPCESKAPQMISNQPIAKAEHRPIRRHCGRVKRVNSKKTIKTSAGESASSKNSSSYHESDSNGYDAGRSEDSNESSENASSGRGNDSLFSICSEDDGITPYESLHANVASKNPLQVNIAEREPPFSSSDYSPSSDDGFDRQIMIPKKKIWRRNDPSLSEATTMEAESDEKPTVNTNGKKIPYFPYFHYTDYSYIGKRLPTGSGAEPDSQDSVTYHPLTRPSKQASFPVKLHAILVRDDLADIITWMPHGRSFKIINIREFELTVLPVYFSSSRVSSFLQDCWEWGFHKMRRGQNKGAFYNEYFLRGIPQLSAMMKHSLAGRLREKSLDESHEPNLLQISNDHPLPDLDEDDLYFQELSMVNRMIHENGPRAKMVSMENEPCCDEDSGCKKNEGREEASNDDSDNMQEDEIESHFAVTPPKQPMRGTHRHMHGYFCERLMVALSRLPMTATQSGNNNNGQHSNSELQKILFEILSHERNFQYVAPEATVVNPLEITPSPSQLQEFSPQVEANENMHYFVSSPFYKEALEAWKSLSQAQAYICANLSTSHSESNANMSTKEEIVDFPSLSSIDSLCTLLVQAVSIGAEIGAEAVTRNVLADTSTDSSYFSSDQSVGSRS